jgi:hypothetical protein
MTRISLLPSRGVAHLEAPDITPHEELTATGDQTAEPEKSSSIGSVLLIDCGKASKNIQGSRLRVFAEAVPYPYVWWF